MIHVSEEALTVLEIKGLHCVQHKDVFFFLLKMVCLRLVRGPEPRVDGCFKFAQKLSDF